MCETPFDKENASNRKHVDCFMDKYLGLDGVFLLRLIAQHADVVFITELIGSLWKTHYAIEEQRSALKRMNRVLPLLCSGEQDDVSPDGPSTRKSSAVASAISKRKLLVQRNKMSQLDRRQSSLRRHASVDEMESVQSKQFADSSSDEESKGKASSRGSSEKRKKSLK
ncbi:hypothetical protein ANCDUO_24459 [Ancylostoma duodenale]|uniref:Uncharacterized protein n=1 Tax=Ancylostoma duodenale TaxID=51022 RepID=A0A0C2FAE9_9BILA|nr:hypothetical protein ANCDUO_24459 [Ancylostoma duodenale]